jgi:hypothetical protein
LLSLSLISIISYLELKGFLTDALGTFAIFVRVVYTAFEFVFWLAAVIVAFFMSNGSGMNCNCCRGGGGGGGSTNSNCGYFSESNFPKNPRQFGYAILVQGAYMALVSIGIAKFYTGESVYCFSAMTWLHAVPPILLFLGLVALGIRSCIKASRNG